MRYRSRLNTTGRELGSEERHTGKRIERVCGEVDEREEREREGESEET